MPPVRATFVVKNGPIHTLESTGTVRALAAIDEQIVALGPDAEELIGPDTWVLDLGGRSAIPGLIDAHVHLLSYGHHLGQIDLHGAASIEDALERVRNHDHDGEWLLGAGFDPNPWARWPTGADLDAIAPDRPVALQSHDHHSLWVNSAALRRAGVTAATAAPAGGEIW